MIQRVGNLMLNKSETSSKNNVQLVAKIEKQRLTTMSMIGSDSSEKEMKILQWLRRKSHPSHDGPMIAFVINTIHNYFRAKTNGINDQKIENLIESCFCHLITHIDCLPEEKIFKILSYLKQANTGDLSVRTELKEFNRLAVFTTTNHFFSVNTLTTLIRLFKKSKFMLNTLLKDQPSFLIDTLARKTTPLVFDSKKLFSYPESLLYAREIKHIPTRKKLSQKKIRTRVIRCDEDGIGYDHDSSYLFFKEAERLNQIYGDEVFFSRRKEKPIRMIEEKCLLENRIAEKEREVFGSEKNVSFIEEKLSEWRHSKGMQSLSVQLCDFERIAKKEIFLIDFLEAMNYENFKALILYAENIIFSIQKIKKTLKKIDLFSQRLGISLTYIYALDDSYERMKKEFNRDKIINYLECFLSLFKQGSLPVNNKYRLFDLQNIKKIKIFQEPRFLNAFIVDNSLKKILERHFEILNEFFIHNDDTVVYPKKYLKNKSNYFKNVLNFLSGQYYFFNAYHKHFFVKKFLFNAYQCVDLKRIENEIFKLKWWHFIVAGMNPYPVFKRGFRERLAKKLFLNLIEEEFRRIEKTPHIHVLDALFSIQVRLKSSKIEMENTSMSLRLLDLPQSRQEIIDRLNSHENVKELLGEISLLSDNAQRCVNELAKALETGQYEHENEKNCSISIGRINV